MYGCPGCGAELKYDIKTGKLRCSRCGNKYDVQAIKKDKDAESSLYEINEYVCPSCGGRIYTADNTIAGFCSYCGASAILQQRTETIDAPKSIVPFKVEKRVCKTKFKNFAKRICMCLMNIRQRTESMNSEEYICHIIVMMRRLPVFMMHMAVQRQLKRKRRKYIQQKILENTRASSWLCKRYYT